MINQTFQDAIDATRQSITRFQKIEGKPWGVEGAIIELAKQVGDLAALVMNEEGYYFANRNEQSEKYASSKDSIADELADIMFAVVRIADHYGIDLVATNIKTRKKEDKFLKTKGV